MNVLLIDADSVIPNIPLMRISTFYKHAGHNVELVKVGLPYYPNRKKKVYYAPMWFDKIFCSVVFEGNRQYIQGDNIIFGGTGVDLKTELPPEIENCEPDYSLYPENKTSYGFLTRGCIKKCPFCKVTEKEGYIRRVADIDDIVRHKNVKFLDNNILSSPDHKEIFRELIDRKIKCEFNQGLDISLLDEEDSYLISRLNYYKLYTFAFDSWFYREIIEKKLKLLKWAKDWQLRFFVYVNPSMPIKETVDRIIYLKERKILPYVMRDIKCWDSHNNEFYVDIASYTNQVHIFKKMDFKDFLIHRHTSKQRIDNSMKTWVGGLQHDRD